MNGKVNVFMDSITKESTDREYCRIVCNKIYEKIHATREDWKAKIQSVTPEQFFGRQPEILRLVKNPKIRRNHYKVGT